MLMIFPFCCFCICGTTALAQSHEPRPLTAIALSNSSTVISPERPLPNGHEVSGVVDENIDSAELLDCLIDHRSYTFLIRHIAAHTNSRSAHILDRPNDWVRAGHVRQRNLCSFFGESHRVSFGDLSAPTGDDDRLVCETHL